MVRLVALLTAFRKSHPAQGASGSVRSGGLRPCSLFGQGNYERDYARFSQPDRTPSPLVFCPIHTLADHGRAYARRPPPRQRGSTT